MEKYHLDWERFKIQLINKGFYINYIEKKLEGKTLYEVFVIDRQIMWSTFLNNEFDILEFENNYKEIANKKIENYSTLFYAEQFKNIALYQKELNLSNEDFTEIINVVPEEGKVAYLTDILFSATEDGELRIKLNGYEVGYAYYGKRRFVDLNRQVPFVIPGGYILSFEFKPNVSGANAVINIGGYKI